MNRSWTRYWMNASYQAVAGGILGPSNVMLAGILFAIDAVAHCVALPQKPASECLNEQYWG